MKCVGVLGLLLVVSLLTCAPALLSYDVDLAVGNKNTQRIVNELKKKNEKYRIVPHSDSLFEIHHNFKYK